MLRRLTFWGRTLRFPLLFTFATLPVPLLLTLFLAPQSLLLVGIWPLCYVTLDAVSTRIPGKWRIAYGLGALAVLGAVAVGMQHLANTPQISHLFILYAAGLMIGLALSPEGRNEQLHPLWFALGIVLHLAAQVFLRSERLARTGELSLVSPWLLVSFFLFLLLMLVTLNQSNLTSVARGRRGVPQSVQRKNLLLTLGFLGLATVLSFVPSLVSLVSRGFQLLLGAIGRLLLFLDRLLQPQTVNGGGGTGEDMTQYLPGGNTENQIPLWLQQVLTVILLLFIAALTVLALYLTVRKLIGFFRRIGQMLETYLQAASEDYIDEITDTREEDRQAQHLARKKQRRSAADMRRLSPSQQVRLRYRRLRQKHPEWATGTTARETLPARAATIYERVRYGEYPATEEDARQFTNETRKA